MGKTPRYRTRGGIDVAALREVIANPIELSIVMPCLDEAETVATCVGSALESLDRLGVVGEVVVADNGSSDGSQQLAERAGARVVSIEHKGYGHALRGGIEAARGKYIIMGDADDSYDFSRLDAFLDRLRAGYDLVMGDRFSGGVDPGAMPRLHRYVGNPVLSGIGRLFFSTQIHDFHCGLRGFRRDSAMELDLKTPGMEFASELVVKASLKDMKITEVPTTLRVAGRSRAPHLRSFRDGWRHLRFLLLHSPRWLFFIPGVLLMAVGVIGSAILMTGPKRIGAATFDTQVMLYASAAIIIGYQTVLFSLFTKILAVREGWMSMTPGLLKAFRYVRLRTGIALGVLLFLAGAGGSVYALVRWSAHSFGPLNLHHSLRIVVPSLTAMILGSETMVGSFFLSVLRLNL